MVPLFFGPLQNRSELPSLFVPAAPIFDNEHDTGRSGRQVLTTPPLPDLFFFFFFFFFFFYFFFFFFFFFFFWY